MTTTRVMCGGAPDVILTGLVLVTTPYSSIGAGVHGDTSRFLKLTEAEDPIDALTVHDHVDTFKVRELQRRPTSRTHSGQRLWPTVVRGGPLGARNRQQGGTVDDATR